MPTFRNLVVLALLGPLAAAAQASAAAELAITGSPALATAPGTALR